MPDDAGFPLTPLVCLTEDGSAARPVFIIGKDGAADFLETLVPAQAQFLRDQGFTADPGRLHLLPGADGVAGAVMGAGDPADPCSYGGLAAALPPGVWRIEGGDAAAGVLGFCMGAYRARNALTLAQLYAPAQTGEARALAEAIYMVRDLINRPANLLGPRELADFTGWLGKRHGAVVTRTGGDDLAAQYPAVAAVGAGSARPAEVVTLRWRGSAAGDDAPLLALCGKGVCFDTGGYDLKPSSAMLRMKKDMGGAALALGLARLIMQHDLPLRLHVGIGCVENSVSGSAMRPSDVIATRGGLSVEVGNTDAEGRLVLADLLTAAGEEDPDLTLDFATLTGAARVALGPDLPAFFCNHDEWAEHFSKSASQAHDAVWRLPLWHAYSDWIKSPVADLASVASKPMGGAIVAALFLQNFVKPALPWAHFDTYCWNDELRPGRPDGGEATGLRGIWSALRDAAMAKSLRKFNRL